MNQVNEEFSKNSIITMARKSGIKCISQCGIEKVKVLLSDKVKLLAEKLALYYDVCNGKTITKKVVAEFLESEGIYIAQNNS
jgi:hypothetical protein